MSGGSESIPSGAARCESGSSSSISAWTAGASETRSRPPEPSTPPVRPVAPAAVPKSPPGHSTHRWRPPHGQSEPRALDAQEQTDPALAAEVDLDHIPNSWGRWNGYGGRSRCDLCRLGRDGLGEFSRQLNGLGDALLAGHGFHTGTLDALKPLQGREVLTLPLAGGAGSRRHRELALGPLHGGRPRTRRAPQCLGGSVACLERRQFAFERCD